jgi:hypothetical protein
MNIKSTKERIYLFNRALAVNHHERDETLNELIHESLNNLTPADVFYGRDTETLNQREIIKQNTLAMRKQLHYDKQYNPMN